MSERQHLLEKENKNDHIISLWTLLCSRRTDKCTFIDETDRTSVIGKIIFCFYEIALIFIVYI